MSKVVVFRTGKEEYGVPIQNIVSIEKLVKVTPVPGLSPYVKGVIQIREELVPIIDLEYIFYHRFLQTDENTRLVIVQAQGLAVGLLINEAKEIIEIPEDRIKQVGLIQNEQTAYLSGIASLEGRLITLINPEILIHSLDGIEELQEYMESVH